MSITSNCDDVFIPLEQAAVTAKSICSTCERFCHELGAALSTTLSDFDNAKDGNLFKFLYHLNSASLGDLLNRRCQLCTLYWFNIHPDLHVDTSDGTAFTVEVSLTGFEDLRRGGRPSITAALNLTAGAVQLSSEPSLLRIDIQGDYSTSSFLGSDIDADGLAKVVSFRTSCYARQERFARKNKRSFYTGSRVSLDLAKSWLDRCIEGHHSCRQTSTLQMPTRLIDISSSNQSLFVHCTSGSRGEHHVEYVALSHCWGDAQFLKLRKANFLELRDEFSIDELPQTWREAIVVARDLGFKYIWIDALCIIQDSNYDWSLESSLMGSVYGNCSLNLAALDGKSSNEGMFSFRNPMLHTLLYAHCDLTDAIRSGMENSASAVMNAASLPPSQSSSRRLLTASLDQGPICYSDAITKGSLNKRGWVLQERAFSPRTLYFGKTGIFWDCRESELDELSLLIPQSKEFKSLNIKKSLHRSFSNTNPLHSLSSERTIPDAWYNLLNLYCPAKLTFENDRLGAVSGLAKYIQSQTKSQYYAGLWSLTLPDDMLWAVPEPVPLQDGISTTTSRNLSFSWASLGAPSSISWPYRHFKSIIVAIVYEGQVLSAHCKGAFSGDRAQNDDQEGQDDTDMLLSSATTGEIRLSCKVREIPERTFPADYSDDHGLSFFYHLRDKTYPKESTTHFATLRQTMTSANCCLDFGLALHKAEKGYKRVGMFYESYRSDQAGKWDSDFKLHAQKEHAAGDPQGRTTILLT